MSTPNMTDDGYQLPSGTDGVQCVGVKVDDDQVLVINTNRRENGDLPFTPGEMSVFIQGVKAGEYDHLI